VNSQFKAFRSFKTLSVARVSSAFSPASLFKAGEQGAWYDPSDLSTLFQDAAGTIPVTAGNQQVGLMRDKSGRGNHASQTVSSSRPIIRSSGGLWYLEFDGVDDFFVTSAINFAASDKMGVFAGVMKLTDSTLGVVAELSANIGSSDGSLIVTAPSGSASASFSAGFRGTVRKDRTSPLSYAAPFTGILSADGDIAAGSTRLRINGATVASDASGLGTGSFGNWPLYIGRRGGTTLPFRGYLSGLIVRGATTDAATITSIEKLLAAKSGMTM